jgi:hypothetical protein
VIDNQLAAISELESAAFIAKDFRIEIRASAAAIASRAGLGLLPLAGTFALLAAARRQL